MKYKIKYGDGTEEIVKAENFSDAVEIAMEKGKEKETSVTVESA